MQSATASNTCVATHPHCKGSCSGYGTRSICPPIDRFGSAFHPAAAEQPSLRLALSAQPRLALHNPPAKQRVQLALTLVVDEASSCTIFSR